jgi:hypothetical protein
MLLSLENYLLAIEEHLPTALVSSTALSNIRTIARELPPVKMAGFECGLEEIAADADFLVCVDGALDTLTGRNASVKLNNSVVTSPPWQRLRTFCQARSESALLQQISNIWVEFDRSCHSVPILRPSVFFGIDRTKNHQRAAEAGLRLLRGSPLPAQLTRTLSLCFGALPTTARVFQVGMMLSRKTTPVRLCVGGLERGQLLGYLSAVGWPGSMDDLSDVLGSLSHPLQALAVDLDVDGDVGPRLGIECYVGREYSLVNVHPNWELFLKQLVALGLCLPSKRDALLAWPGYAFREAVLPSLFLRGINHVKVVWEPPGLVYAKAYLSFVHAWRGSITEVSRQTGETPSRVGDTSNPPLIDAS